MLGTGTLVGIALGEREAVAAGLWGYNSALVGYVVRSAIEFPFNYRAISNFFDFTSFHIFFSSRWLLHVPELRQQQVYALLDRRQQQCSLVGWAQRWTVRLL